MRKIIIKLIDHDGSDIDREIPMNEHDDVWALDLNGQVESMLDTLNTDFDTKQIKVGHSPFSLNEEQ